MAALGPTPGFTPQQQADYAAGRIDRFGNPINGAAGGTRPVSAPSIIATNNNNTIAKNAGVVNQLQSLPGQVGNAAQYANAYDQFALGTQQGLAGTTSGLLGQASGLGFQNAGQANAAGQTLINNLGNYYASAPYASYSPITGDPYGTGLQTNALNNFSGMMNGSMNITAAQAPAAAQAQAAYATAALYNSNPADIARQQEAYNQLQAIAGGSLDWKSQAAQAYANPQTERKQWDVFNNLEAASLGSLDQQSQASKTYVSPETLKQQQQGMDKLWGLTDPSITPQEQMMMEIARRQQEQTERASRGAVMADLQSRGFGGSGAQMTSMLGAQEQAGQERTLADLGAQANASARATSALGMYVDAAGKLRSQEFDEAFARAAAGDQMAVVNANRRLQAMGMSADQINNMRTASFDEAYKRGLAADNASAANQNTRLQGAGMAGNQANAIRDANDAVGQGNANRQTQVSMQNSVNQTNTNQFNAGQTNQVNMFNTGEQNRIGIANQDVRARGAEDYGTQANAIRNANDAIAMHNSTEQTRVGMFNVAEGDYRASDLTSKGIAENTNAYNRNQTAIDNSTRNALANYGVGMDLVGAYGAYGQNTYNRSLGTAQLTNDIGRTSIQNNLNENALRNQPVQTQMSEDAFNRAAAFYAKPEDQGLLGLGLGIGPVKV